jgi:hypothetical protein
MLVGSCLMTGVGAGAVGGVLGGGTAEATGTVEFRLQ